MSLAVSEQKSDRIPYYGFCMLTLSSPDHGGIEISYYDISQVSLSVFAFLTRRATESRITVLITLLDHGSYQFPYYGFGQVWYAYVIQSESGEKEISLYDVTPVLLSVSGQDSDGIPYYDFDWDGWSGKLPIPVIWFQSGNELYITISLGFKDLFLIRKAANSRSVPVIRF